MRKRGFTQGGKNLCRNGMIGCPFAFLFSTRNPSHDVSSAQSLLRAEPLPLRRLCVDVVKCCLCH